MVGVRTAVGYALLQQAVAEGLTQTDEVLGKLVASSVLESGTEASRIVSLHRRRHGIKATAFRLRCHIGVLRTCGSGIAATVAIRYGGTIAIAVTTRVAQPTQAETKKHGEHEP